MFEIYSRPEGFHNPAERLSHLKVPSAARFLGRVADIKAWYKQGSIEASSVTLFGEAAFADVRADRSP